MLCRKWKEITVQPLKKTDKNDKPAHPVEPVGQRS